VTDVNLCKENNRWKMLAFLVEPILAYIESSQTILIRICISSQSITDILQHSSRGSHVIAEESTNHINVFTNTTKTGTYILQNYKHGNVKRVVYITVHNILNKQ
jgi:hypothetical protein